MCVGASATAASQRRVWQPHIAAKYNGYAYAGLETRITLVQSFKRFEEILEYDSVSV